MKIIRICTGRQKYIVLWQCTCDHNLNNNLKFLEKLAKYIFYQNEQITTVDSKSCMKLNKEISHINKMYI